MRTDWNALLAEPGEKSGAVFICRRKPISDRAKERMVVVMGRRGNLASPRYSGFSLVALMRDTRHKPYPNVQKLQPKKEISDG